MSKLSQLGKRKKKVYNINGVDLEFEALGAKEILQFDLDPNNPATKQAEETIKLLKHCLRKAVPDATEEEIEEALHMGNLQQLQQAIFEVNDLADPSKQSRAKQMVERQKKNLEQNKQA